MAKKKGSIDPTTFEQQLLLIKDFMVQLTEKVLSIDGLKKEGDFTLSQLKTIFAFKEDKAYTMTELGKNIGVANPRMTILIDELESMNIVERIRDNKDRRIVKVKLTEKGKDLREQFMQKRRKEVLTLFSRLKPEQRQDLLRCLKKTSSILENIKTKED